MNAGKAANAPESILDAWTALEVLSPQTFRRPEDLTGGDRKKIVLLDREPLPWLGSGETPPPKTKLYYQIVLGSIDMEKTVSQLLVRYADTRAERPAARGEAILAVAVVDRDGRLVDAPATALSSFAWGVPHALNGDLEALAGWCKVESDLVESVDEILRLTDDDGRVLPVTEEAILAAHEWLINALELPRDLLSPTRLVIRAYESSRNPEPPDPLLLNSFYLGDLAAARERFAQGKSTHNLRRYLGIDPGNGQERHDLLQEPAALEAAVAPGLIPPSRWPGEGRHPLVLLQQAAVNLAIRELRGNGILAVNGPPGTGKTTLLRDLAAAVVTARAEAMLGFEDPVAAFSHSGQKLKVSNAWLHLYRLDPRLRGFEMIVASSNNKAVENVSAELPDLKKIAGDARDLRYFKTLSDALHQRETWGLVSAVLGNAANRSRFRQTFWWDEDCGLSSYLAEAAGTPQLIDVTDPRTRERTTRPPRIVSQERPPGSHEEALRRWREACTAFRRALEKSRGMLKALDRLRESAVSLGRLAREEADAIAAEASARDAEQRNHASVEEARSHLELAQANLAQIERTLADQEAAKPGFFARLFRTLPARQWRAGHESLIGERRIARETLSTAAESLQASEQTLDATQTRRKAAEAHRKLAVTRHQTARRDVAGAREQLGRSFIDEDFFARGHAERHQTAPWLDAERQRIRDDVFVAAMALHKAFIDAAAKPLRHNLGALMNVFGGRSLPTEKRALVPDLWASLFLVVPLLSTTFASVERMLGDLPAESLGWLIVDEAGQALPQAAVGALTRTLRAVVVGDPVQIEPIVILPETLTHAICRHFGVDPDLYNAPSASVQTLADAATPYMAEFQGKQGSRTVGVPLLVHRRCADPMFSISNAVAYERLMVHAKSAGRSVIGDLLGPSGWIDVQGRAAEKWCPEEGEMVLSLLRQLATRRIAAEGYPDLYIVTPFVVVADSLRKLVRESGVLNGWTDDPGRWTMERIGTVHTVQGREAEAVLFVLGAPAPEQIGARSWAGGRPNLLNVAVTRAKERLYVIGNRDLWRGAGLFRELDARLRPFDTTYTPPQQPMTEEPEEIEEDESRPRGPIYALESQTSCWSCHRETPVVALAFEEPSESGEPHLVLLSQIESLDAKLTQILNSRYPQLRMRYSKSAGLRYFMNHCGCGAPLGDFYLHQESGGSFVPATPEEASRILLRQLPFSGEIKVEADSSTDELIWHHARRESF